MSEGAVPIVKVVCEGDTDSAIISAIADALADRELSVECIQPERPLSRPDRYGELWSGWEGVQRWCERQRERFGSLHVAMANAPLCDSFLLAVHVDADIAVQAGVEPPRPCPPPSDTVDALREVVLKWAGEDTVPPGVVLCVPSQAIEAWVFAALYPDAKLTGDRLECRPKPETLLKQKPGKLVTGKENKKQVGAYREAAPRIAAKWPLVCEICSSEAPRFDRELRAALSLRPSPDT